MIITQELELANKKLHEVAETLENNVNYKEEYQQTIEAMAIIDNVIKDKALDILFPTKAV